MNMTLAAATPDMSERYAVQTQAAKRSVDPRTRAFASLDRARAAQDNWSRTSVAVRNMALLDALQLLSPPTDSRPDEPSANGWSFVDLGEHQQRLAILRDQFAASQPNDAAIEALGLLQQLVEKSELDTYPSYAAFKQAQQAFVTRNAGEALDDDLALQRYDAWLRRYRPYVVLGIPLDDPSHEEEAERAIRSRIGFFLEKNPVPALQGRFEDRLWTYVYDVRYCANPRESTAA